ncbi:MAG TPA: Glu-tRNA(Gln) amidotransferase subunit GatD [Candidatus Krumholzibacteriaceae bacterium]|nr:Glu-tRNA(Gln) amidotransferase subunit GatD [Candidatus Krumholzibacteriaceae bacterium]
MSEEKLLGYKGKVLQALRKAGAEIGDRVRITKNGQVYEGILIPRSEYADDKHVVVKMRSGYNIGVQITEDTKIEKIGEGAKPSFQPPPLPKQKENLPKVAILSTGGTIASRVDYRTGGVRPALTANDLYSVVPELADVAAIETEIVLSIFSENITTQNWTEIAKNVAKHIENGKAGVVIPHGTDTLGYTAAALSFALQNLPVPVVLVGSQRSADRPSSDAATNLLAAVKAAAVAPFAGVFVAMHETVSDRAIVFHRGTKVRKCHTSRRDTFKSINTPPVARLEDEKFGMLLEDYEKRDSRRKLVLKPDFDEKVALVKFHPVMNPKVIEWYVDNGFRGIVLEGTGLGHISKILFPAISKAVESDVIVAMTSQCIWGRLGMNVYDTGRDLLAMGVVPLEDMLAETALVKLMWVLGLTKKVDEAKQLLKTNIAHEFSPRTTYAEEDQKCP